MQHSRGRFGSSGFAHRARCVASCCFLEVGEENLLFPRLLGTDLSLGFHVLLRLDGLLLRFVLSLLCLGRVDAFADAFGVGDLLSAFQSRGCWLIVAAATLSEG